MPDLIKELKSLLKLRDPSIHYLKLLFNNRVALYAFELNQLEGYGGQSVFNCHTMALFILEYLEGEQDG